MKNSSDLRRSPAKPSKIDVYYDGGCAMCVSLINGVRQSTKAGDFRLHDMRQARSPPFPKAAVEREIHVTDQDGAVHRGPAAVLRIAEQYPRLRPLARAARTPAARAFAPTVYRLVAGNGRFLFGPESRLYWLKVAVVVTFCVELAMSARLWVGPRSYPMAPMWDALPVLPAMAAYVLFVGLFVLGGASLVASRPRWYLTAFLAILGVLCLLDETRWQAWVFQLGFLMASLALYSWRADDASGRERTVNIARLIISATYIYSGLQKINGNFMDNDFPWIVQPITNLIPQAAGALHSFGMAAPFLQVAFGVGLLTSGIVRRISLVLAVAMHLFILAMLGPLGQNWNDIVWPWTAAMAVFDLLLFAGHPQAGAREILWPGRHAFHLTALLFFAVLPALSFVNLWDSALSAALYSGNLTEAQIYVNDAGRRGLPPDVARYLAHTSPDTNILNLQRWASEDLNVVPYSETRLFKRIARGVCGELSDPADLALVVREQRLLFSQPETTYRCWEL